MPFDGAGNFTRDYSWTADKIAGIKIEAARMDGEFDNYATAMNQVMLRNGVVPWGGNIQMAGNLITGLGSGTVPAPALRFLGDTTTGLYLQSAGNLGLVAGSVERLRLNSAGGTVTGNFAATGTLAGTGLFLSNAEASGLVPQALQTVLWFDTPNLHYLRGVFGAAGKLSYVYNNVEIFRVNHVTGNMFTLGDVSAATATIAGAITGASAAMTGAITSATVATTGAIFGQTITSGTTINAGTNIVATGTMTAAGITSLGTVGAVAGVFSGALSANSLTIASAFTIAGDVVASRALVNAVVFPATQVSSGDPNTLDDYEEGTFTPLLRVNTLTAGITYSFQAGVYTKIGRMFWTIGNMQLTSKGANVGPLTITPLAFTPAGAGSVGSCMIENPGAAFTPSVAAVGTTLNINNIAAGGVVLANTDIANNSIFTFSIGCATST